MTTLIFNNKPLQVIKRNNQIWLTSAELAKALQYKSAKSVTNIFNSNSDEFTTCMTEVIESVTSGNYKKRVRIFSLRGCHLVAMLSRTIIAKMFRKWVLDILDKESGVIEVKPITDKKYRYFVEVKITDHMFNGEKTILGRCNNFNALLTHLALGLGYKIEHLSASPHTLSF